MKDLVFVIQLHDATSLHYDFRLQIGKTMPSWAIAKGPTLDNTVKRLAFKTTDHDLEYRHFEGSIPEGKYGAGPVIIWDTGEYIPEVEIEKGVRKEILDPKAGNEVMEQGLNKGEIKFFLKGKRLKGSFALVKTKGFPPGKSENAWLLIKHKDKYVKPDYDPGKFQNSVVSKKTLKDFSATK